MFFLGKMNFRTQEFMVTIHKTFFQALPQPKFKQAMFPRRKEINNFNILSRY